MQTEIEISMRGNPAKLRQAWHALRGREPVCDRDDTGGRKRAQLVRNRGAHGPADHGACRHLQRLARDTGSLLMTRLRCAALLLLFVLTAGCSGQETLRAATPSDFGVLVMAHGGAPEWDQGVLAAVKPLQDDYKLEVAFGMADAVTIQEGVRRLEAKGVRKIGVVRLFVSGESWHDRTEKILGLSAGAPPPPTASDHAHPAEHHGHDHSMAFWKIDTQASFALTTQGLAEAPEMGAILADRAKALSQAPQSEDVLILAHGPADDSENRRWIDYINARADVVRQSLPFRRVRVETLREDWPGKREEAERRIRAFVKRAADEGSKAIVIPYRVQGFGPYARVLHDLDYVSDGLGFLPHPNVTKWIEQQIRGLQAGSFRTVADR